MGSVGFAWICAHMGFACGQCERFLDVERHLPDPGGVTACSRWPGDRTARAVPLLCASSCCWPGVPDGSRRTAFVCFTALLAGGPDGSRRAAFVFRYRTARAVPLLCASQRCWPGDRTARAVPLLCFGTGRLAPCRFCVLHSITDEWGSRGNNKGTEVARFATRRQGCIVKTRGKQDCARSNCRETINERNREHLETAAKDLRHRSPNR
jgi:hypothetical protein